MSQGPATEPSWRRPFEAVDPCSLAFFRLAVGAILIWEAWRFLALGWAVEFYAAPAFHFRYFGFEWVEPLSADGMVRLFTGLALAALFMAVGFLPRLMSGLLAVGWGYVFLLEQARYLNHMYLLVLLLGLMACVPCGADLTVRQLLGRPRRRIPALGLLTVRSQMGLVYLFAGIAKLNDDWLGGAPLNDWLAARGELPVLGPLLTLPLSGVTFAWAGLAVDLLAWPALEHRTARYSMFAVLVLFHVTNFFLFHIGIFPWMALAITTLWLPPDWPRRVMRRMTEARAAVMPARRPLLLGLVALWFSVQFAMPLRHHLYPGEVAWTEEGHRFSWRMKLRSKRGEAIFRVADPDTGEQRLVDPAEELESWQLRKLATRPEMVLQYAHHLADRARVEGRHGVEVRAVVECSLNGRPAELLVDPDVDLARVTRSLAPASWITSGPFPEAPTAAARDDGGEGQSSRP